MAFTSVRVAALVALAAAAKPCCQGHCPNASHKKYWSIAESVFGTPHCGECCMDPSKYRLYHFFEANLTLSTTDSPCADRGYPRYDSTVTHGFGPVSMTLDLYDLPKTGGKPCCQGHCPDPSHRKYFSIAKSILFTPHCGECCMKPSDYKLYHFFEKNLTLSDTDSPCADRGYPKYDSTVTHGFGPVKMTLDLYDLPKQAESAPAEPVSPPPEAAMLAQKPCCQGHCPNPDHRKYWSIAKSIFGTPHCGECCMKTSDYKLYHFFEKNLTLADTDSPCADRGYPKYDSTTTHGFGPVKMTLDLYDLPKLTSEAPIVII